MHMRYRGRPLAFLTEAEHQEIGSKISEGLRRSYQQHPQKKHLKAIESHASQGEQNDPPDDVSGE